MRLLRLRRWSRVVALVLLAASVRPIHAASDDQACSIWPAALSAQGGVASLDTGNGPAPGAPEHCALCHWTRLLRSPLTQTGLTIAAVATATPLDKPGAGSYVSPADDHLPARAPPAFLG
jgi:hypothetical protein